MREPCPALHRSDVDGLDRDAAHTIEMKPCHRKESGRDDEGHRPVYGSELAPYVGRKRLVLRVGHRKKPRIHHSIIIRSELPELLRQGGIVHRHAALRRKPARTALHSLQKRWAVAENHYRLRLVGRRAAFRTARHKSDFHHRSRRSHCISNKLIHFSS